jgi:hypothetical protein
MCAFISRGDAQADASRGDAEHGRAGEEADALGEAGVGRGHICGPADVGRTRRNGAALMRDGAADDGRALHTTAELGLDAPAG